MSRSASVDAWLSSTHYFDHAVPILNALSPDALGTIYTPPKVQKHAAALGHRVVVRSPPDNAKPILIAGGSDLPIIGNRPCALLEHGAGQSYGDVNHPSYAVGAGRDRVDLFLCPNSSIAARNQARYPDAQYEVYGSPRVEAMRHNLPGAVPGTVVAFHWPCRISVESSNAWVPFSNYLSLWSRIDELAPLSVHAHPRFADHVRRFCAEKSIPYVEDPWLAGSLLIADNTSLMYEWAALDRPVVCLNSPLWRRNVEHGLRFWSQVPGPEVNDPIDIVDACRQSTSDHWHHKRRDICSMVYPANNNSATHYARALGRWAYANSPTTELR